jgi:protein phosphatase
MLFYAITDPGQKRAHNEDYVFASDASVGGLPNLFIVADGMGGHNAGDIASETAVKAILEQIRKRKIKTPTKALEEAINHANKAVFDCAKADESKAGMGTTLVAATVVENRLHVANVGDSRLYIVRGGELVQVTHDHSLVEEMLRSGTISKAAAEHHPAKHKITRAVGVEEDVRIDFFDEPMDDIRAIFLCSDGLSNMVEAETIRDVLASDKKVKQKAERLVELANAAGGKDNITVLVIDTTSDEVKEC